MLYASPQTKFTLPKLIYMTEMRYLVRYAWKTHSYSTQGSIDPIGNSWRKKSR